MSLSSVDNALRLVHVLAQREEVGVAEAGRLLGVARSTAHRLLTSLVVHGFAEQDPESRAYRAGGALLEFGLATVRRYDVRAHARPYLEQLSERTGETTHLLVLAGADTLFLDSVEGSQSVRTTGRVERRSRRTRRRAARRCWPSWTRRRWARCTPTSSSPR